MAAHPIVIPLSKFTSYSDAFLGSAVSSTKQLLSLSLPVPASLFLPPSTLEQFYQSSPQRQRVIELYRQVMGANLASVRAKKITQLKNTIATLVIHRQLVHTLTDWYHDYLGSDEVITSAAHVANLSRQFAKGNVNFIESILSIWAESLEQCLLKKGQSPQACLTPTGIFIQAQPKVDLSGVIFTNHPQKLTKASLMVYLWKNALPSDHQTPEEILDLDMRSGMILRRQQPTTNISSKPILIDKNQLANIVNYGSRIKQHFFQDTTASFIIAKGQLFFTQLPAQYQLEASTSKKSHTATKLLLYTSLLSEVKRIETIGDGVGIFNIDLAKQTQTQLLATIQNICQLSPPNQTMLLQPPANILAGDWSRYAQFLKTAQEKINRPLALLVTDLKIPEDWLAVINLPIFKNTVTQFRLLWLEIATPALALALRCIDLNQVGGIVINHPLLMAWAGGSNLPAKHTQEPSAQSHLVFSQLLEVIMTVVKSRLSIKPLPVWVEISKADPLIIAKIINAGCQAVLSSASELSTIKNCIQEAERDIWKSRMIT